MLFDLGLGGSLSSPYALTQNQFTYLKLEKKWFKVIVKYFRTKKHCFSGLSDWFVQDFWYLEANLIWNVSFLLCILYILYDFFVSSRSIVKSSTSLNKRRFCWHLRYDKAWTWLRWGLAFERAKTLLENLICSPHYLSTTYLHSSSFMYLLNPGLKPILYGIKDFEKASKKSITFENLVVSLYFFCWQ